MTLSLFGFLFMTAVFDENGLLDITNFGAKGYLRLCLWHWSRLSYTTCKKHNMTIRMPEGVPDFVSKSFELIPVTLLVGGTLFLGASYWCKRLENFTNDLDSLPVAVGRLNGQSLVSAGAEFLYLFDFLLIHSSVFSPITRPIMVAFIAENITAFQAGQPIPHFYTAGASSAFFGFTGCGISIGCVIACLVSKSNAIAKSERSHCFQPCSGLMNPFSLVHRLFWILDVYPACLWRCDHWTLPMFFCIGD